MRESTNEMIALFEKAREEYFEDGMESNFSRGAIPRNDAFARREWHHSLT